MDVPPYRLSGTVYGTLLNHRCALAALGDAVNQPPYNGAPQAPVLYVKPRNTLRSSGAAVTVPADAPELEIGACLGLVIGRAACRLSERAALDSVAGFLIVNDISVPHASLLSAFDPLQGARRFLPARPARHGARRGRESRCAHASGLYRRTARGDGQHRPDAAGSGQAARRRDRIHDAGRGRCARDRRGFSCPARARRPALPHRDRRHRYARDPFVGPQS